jgi:hypothetical protein
VDRRLSPSRPRSIAIQHYRIDSAARNKKVRVDRGLPDDFH